MKSEAKNPVRAMVKRIFSAIESRSSRIKIEECKNTLETP
jgi:hypothetical protein